MNPDLFTASLGRFPSIARYFPGENIGTEITAAVLNKVEPLRIEMARWLADRAGTALSPVRQVEVATQVPTGSGSDQVDLQIAIPSEALIWVEAKYWSHEGREQTSRYWESLEARSERDGFPTPLLFYLTPLGAKPPEAPKAIPISWQDWVEAVEDWRARGLGEPWQLWLAGEYSDYLYDAALVVKEVPLDNLDTVSGAYASARNALKTLHYGVTSNLADRGWAEVDPQMVARADHRTVEHALDWWCVYEAEGFPADEHLQFDFVLDPKDDYRRILAGLIWRPNGGGASNPIDANGSWWHSLEKHGFFRHPADGTIDGTVRLYREFPLTSLNSSRRVGEQAERVADFIHQTFELLRLNPLRG